MTLSSLSRIHILSTLVLLAAFISGGCTILGAGVAPARQDPLRPDAPVLVTELGRRLAGSPVEAIYHPAKVTIPEVPMTTTTIREVTQRVLPAVVNIYTKTAQPYRVTLPFFGGPKAFSLPGKALGSAFFIHESGYLLTNNHVIQNAAQITAKTTEGTEYDLVVVARDPAYDLALLRTHDTGTVVFPYVPIGSSDQIAAGDMVIAIGNPFGLGSTVTTGVVSQTERTIPGLEKAEGRAVFFVQTDTAINPGNSGGPLITLSGAAIGVNTAVARGAQGIGFAVPSELTREFITTVLRGAGRTVERY